MFKASPETPFLAETARLRLRQVVNSDAYFYKQLHNDPDFIEHIADRQLHTLEAALANMQERVYASYEAHGFGMYLAERNTNAEPLGLVGLVKRDFLKHVDLGYAFLPAGRGQGLVVEACHAVLDIARDQFGIRRLAAITSPANAASIRVLERLGFRADGEVELPGAEVPAAHFLIDL